MRGDFARGSGCIEYEIGGLEETRELVLVHAVAEPRAAGPTTPDMYARFEGISAISMVPIIVV